MATHVNRNGYTIKRIPAKQFLDKKHPTPYITKKQAISVAKLINNINNPNKPLISTDVMRRGKDYVFTSDDTTDGVISGAAQLRRHDWKRCEVCNVHVAEDYRMQGLGKRLLDKVEERAGMRGFTIMDALVAEDNTPSKRLFKSRKFEKQLIFQQNGQNTLMGVWRKNVKKPCRKRN